MKYTIIFNLRGKNNKVCIDYQKITSTQESGFNALTLPFDVNNCIGYPMLHAYFENLDLHGYERYCGWMQVVERRDYADIKAEKPTTVSFDLDITEEMRSCKNPYFAYGYPAEFFDAPCNNLGDSEKLDWRAYTYLVDMPSRMNDSQLVFLAGFSWGYTEDKDGNVQLSDFTVLSADKWKEHQKYILFSE